MADTTIIETPGGGGGQVRYDLGRPNWESRRIPDIDRPGSTALVAENCMVDVIILGDGFLGPIDFRAALADWLNDFFAVKIYDLFAGAFRIRALFTRSLLASKDRESYYGCRVNDEGTGIWLDDRWWESKTIEGRRFRERFWASVDSFADVNTRRYPATLQLGSNIAVGDGQRDTYRNLIVVMLVRTDADDNVSGAARDVPRDPDLPTTVRCAFGANTIHEFSHAFGYLSDEYIDGRDTENGDRDHEVRINPTVLSVFTCSNLSYSDFDTVVPWLHLAPTGRFRRSAGGSDPPPLAGWMWIGGNVREGAWHSEYRCLMNGTHDNFAFTQETADDPTATIKGTFIEGFSNGENLRDGSRFCAWCQEIVALRILERTDQFVQPSDPADFTLLGRVWFDRWKGLRENYYDLLGVEQQIIDAEAAFAAMTPGASGEPLWQSDLYRVPAARVASSVGPVTALTDEETYLLTS